MDNFLNLTTCSFDNLNTGEMQLHFLFKSSWYVMAALGLFDVKGFTDARPIVEIGSPLFAKATITLGNGKELVIETKNASADNYYIQSAQLNDKPLHNCWLYRDELMKGGKLSFTMGHQPNEEWGVAIPPPSNQ